MKYVHGFLMISVMLGVAIVPACTALAGFVTHPIVGLVVGVLLSLAVAGLILRNEARRVPTREVRELDRPEGMMDELLDSLGRDSRPRG